MSSSILVLWVARQHSPSVLRYLLYTWASQPETAQKTLRAWLEMTLKASANETALKSQIKDGPIAWGR